MCINDKNWYQSVKPPKSRIFKPWGEGVRDMEILNVADFAGSHPQGFYVAKHQFLQILQENRCGFGYQT